LIGMALPMIGTPAPVAFEARLKAGKACMTDGNRHVAPVLSAGASSA
jgi:hypothetical protein